MKLKTFLELFGHLDPNTEFNFYTSKNEFLNIDTFDYGVDNDGKVCNIIINFEEE